RTWMDEGYQTVQRYDEIYSEGLCVRPSIKTTTVKPSGTVSILAGESPGAHWAPGGEFFLRRIRVAKDDPMVRQLQNAGYPVARAAGEPPGGRWAPGGESFPGRVRFGEDDPRVRQRQNAGYPVEPASESPDTTVVISFAVQSKAKRSGKDVTLFEKAHLAALAQRWWSDNSVSVTLSFDQETEGQHVGTVLSMYEGQLKTASFLPQGNATYPQMPYEEISEAGYQDT